MRCRTRAAPPGGGASAKLWAALGGARASKLYARLQAGHHDLKLSSNDLYLLTLWLDANTNFFGAYCQTDLQAQGQVVWPTLE